MNTLARSLVLSVAVCLVLRIAGANAQASEPSSPTASPTRLMPGQAITITDSNCASGKSPVAVLDADPRLPAVRVGDKWRVVLPVTLSPQKAYSLKWACDPPAKNETPPQIAVIEVIPLTPTVIGAARANAGDDDASTVELTNRLEVQVRDLKPWRELSAANAAATLHPYLGGIALTNLSMMPEPDCLEESGSWISTLAVPLEIDEKNIDARKAWVQVLRTAMQVESNEKRWVSVSVGPTGGLPFPSANVRINLKVYPSYRWGVVVFLALLALVLVILGKKSNLLRDANGAAHPPYSLARHQMAVWLLVVVGGYLYAWLVTGTNVISNTALILIGISGATGLAAVVIDNGKRDDEVKARAAAQAEQASLQELVDGHGGLRTQFNAAAPGSPEALQTGAILQLKTTRLAELTTLLAQPAPAPKNSQRWYLDLLSDEKGISFHRLQIAVWTVVLVAVFIRDVYTQLVMPEFDSTMLGLMGVTSGTYLGFKFPEKK